MTPQISWVRLTSDLTMLICDDPTNFLGQIDNSSDNDDLIKQALRTHLNIIEADAEKLLK